MIAQLRLSVVVMLAAMIMTMLSWRSSSSVGVHGFATVPPSSGGSGALGYSIRTNDGTNPGSLSSSSASSTRLFGGGFGGGGGSPADSAGAGKNKRKGQSNKPPSLKPKQQWDRYAEFKKEDKVRVAVRCRGEGESEEWLEVGRVKSKGNEYTEVAVAVQRALIAEVRATPRACACGRMCVSVFVYARCQSPILSVPPREE
jgi:hypothetical protein